MEQGNRVAVILTLLFFCAVTLSEAKGLAVSKTKILRFAQNDNKG
jgi:hypothetical protein